MGCILSNIVNMDKSPFKCSNNEEQEEFLNELAYDIASNHPDFVLKINQYVKKLKKPSVVRELTNLDLADLCSSLDKLDATGHTVYAIQFDERLQELGKTTGLAIPEIKNRVKEYKVKR